MKPSKETIIGIFAAALEQHETAQRAMTLVIQLTEKHGYDMAEISVAAHRLRDKSKEKIKSA